MPDLLLEVGTEEMPAAAIPGSLAQLERLAAQKMESARLAPRALRTLGTPRRLILLAFDVPERQPTEVREVRGPAWDVAFSADGAPTGAALGFARKQGIRVEDLRPVETPQGRYVSAEVRDVGKSAAEALGAPLADCLRALTFPKTMRWGDKGVRFVRPVRWIVCTLGGQVVPVEFAGVRAGDASRGHRYLSPESFTVEDTPGFIEQLRARSVMADPAEREARIRAQAETLAADVGGRIPWDEELLSENVHLVEWPTCLLGRFDERYMDLPRPVLVTAMRKHQRFFPVEGPSGDLLPCFVSVRNGSEASIDKVKAGNEAVLAARFADAHHFFEQDRAETLDRMTGRLERLLFQDRLGAMAQKRDRLVRLAAPLGVSHGLDERHVRLAERAAELCKGDLTSQMVIELPSLQGVMGREYAALQGEEPEVALAIAEHYQPRGAGDALPVSPVGKLLAVADRIDTLVGYAGIGIMPTGSADPYGLRRAAHGLVQILALEPDVPSLASMQVQAAEGYRIVNGLDFDLDPLCNALQGLFNQRVAAYLDERGVRYDLRDAALYGGLAYGTIVYGVVQRAQALSEVAGTEQFSATVQAAARVANILSSREQAPVPGKEGIHGGRTNAVERASAVLYATTRDVHPDRFAEPAETGLYEAACGLLPEVARGAAVYDYASVYAALQSLREPVGRFFDDVLVMCEDAEQRANRLALLRLVDALYRTLADFRKVVIV
ncbi:MAG: glycine--tRNA ligase subunit beta [Chthonomonadales bacterium]|nr:glycine--tRNA ligase subunit beta [Chthonomonadales bacterium]